MIETLGIWLIMLTVWSAIVWLIARALPERYLAWPAIWLGLIAASLAPALIAPLLPAPVEEIIPVLPVTVQAVMPDQPAAAEASGSAIPWLIVLPAAAYLLVALFLIARIFLTYFRLWRLAGKTERGGIFSSPAIATPVATALPFRAILLPEGLEGAARDLIIRHETRHMERGDPEMTLALETLRALMWINLPFRALIRRWRLAAELAVDTHILTGSSEQQRRDYADILINELSRIRRRAVPCPSAALTLSEERSAKMRVSNILSPAAGMRKPAVAAIIASGVCLTALGTGFAAMLTAGQESSERDYIGVIDSSTDVRMGCDLETLYSFDYPIIVQIEVDIAAGGSPSAVRILGDLPHQCLVDYYKASVMQFKFSTTKPDGSPIALPQKNVPIAMTFNEPKWPRAVEDLE